MDLAGLSAIAEAIAKSSSAFMFIAVYIAWRATRAANEAVEAIKQIRDIAVKAEPVVESIAEQVEDIHRYSTAIDSRTSTFDLRLTALTANKGKS